MNGLIWCEVAPGHAGFGRFIATQWALRSVLHTMMPETLREEFFGASGVMS